jgi:uncharacterized protein YpuA (DUF1002 family)
MGLETAALIAVGGLGVAQYQQQGATGKYNQSIQNRNAEIARQEAAQIDKQLETDLGRFENQYVQLQGKTQVSIAKSGVSDEGTARRIARANAEQAELDRETMKYNAAVNKISKLETANYYQIQGQVARNTARAAQLQTITSTGTSLLGMSGYGKISPSSSTSSIYSGPSAYSGY